MYKNIVFDFGGVMVDFDPHKYLIDLFGNRKIYYKTAYNSTIRCIDLKNINFNTVRYQSFPLDKTRQQPIEYLPIE